MNERVTDLYANSSTRRGGSCAPGSGAQLLATQVPVAGGQSVKASGTCMGARVVVTRRSEFRIAAGLDDAVCARFRNLDGRRG